MTYTEADCKLRAGYFPIQVRYTEWPYKGQEWQHLTVEHIKKGCSFKLIDCRVDLPPDQVTRRVK